eukprot:684805-Pelagomonas_calceolata.AAC.1
MNACLDFSGIEELEHCDVWMRAHACLVGEWPKSLVRGGKKGKEEYRRIQSCTCQEGKGSGEGLDLDLDLHGGTFSQGKWQRKGKGYNELQWDLTFSQ